MKNVIGFLALSLIVSLLSCQDTGEEIGSSPPEEEYKAVGIKIPTETGARWIDAYNRQNSIDGRLLGILYSVNKSELDASIASVDELIGIAFHYGFDGNGEKHIILIPVDASMSLWNEVPGRIYIDANSSTVISKQTAAAWAGNYKAVNPNAIWFHYFGRFVFDDILSIAGFTSMAVVPALDDLDLSPELLLIVGNSLNLLGRTSTETSVYDASYPCPKCAVQ